MELEEFIASSLSQITNGVVRAAADVRDAGGSINPGARSSRGMERCVQVGRGLVPVLDVEFDVAVVASGSEESRAGIAVAGGFFGLGGSQRQETGDEQVSRLRFTVPLVLPPGESDERGGEGYDVQSVRRT